MIGLGEFVIGLLALIGGAELVVRSGTRLAARFGISPMVIGVTVVAVGTISADDRRRIRSDVDLRRGWATHAARRWNPATRRRRLHRAHSACRSP
ncbi:hypothetical protein [Cryobacterium sp. M25]|uniref:hypothetical protein n=1 Tax=Cryobacterium sp. M25 TaxID=2048293 RepID=UPI0011B0DF25